MWVKIQNFLFLLCCAFIGKFLYTAFLMIIVSLSLANHWLWLDYYFPYLQAPANLFYPLAIIIGVVSLFYTRFASYFYQASCFNFPRLQWYAIFLGWILVGKEFLTEIQLFVMLLIGCIVAALYDKKHTWKQRAKTATVFSVMLVSFLCGYFGIKTNTKRRRLGQKYLC